MRIPRIFTPQALHKDLTLTLEESASRHLCQVLRLGPGAQLTLFNGDGAAYIAEILAAERKGAGVRVVARHSDTDTESPLAIHLGIGLSKGERFDIVLQKATELGVASITPLQSQRVEVRLKPERLARKQRHWQQVLASACEQCGRNRLPDLAEPTTLENWLVAVDAEQKWVLDPAASTTLDTGTAPRSAALLVGPEGGLSETEIERARAGGFQSLRLGPRVLRTETAPLAALAILQHRWGDL